MSKKKRRIGRAEPDAGPRPPGSPAPRQPEIPDHPPMADRRSRWPLVAVLIVFALWLAYLVYIALHTSQW